MKDLIVLTADRQIEAAVSGILKRFQSLGIRPVQSDFSTHPRRDPGCFHEAPSFLRPLRGQYQHALVVLDWAWARRDARSAVELEVDLNRRLSSDWAQKGASIVIDPEIEAWIWSPSPHVDSEMGWTGRAPDLRSWLRAQGLLDNDAVKPREPKEAAERALRVVNRPRSSALFSGLAAKVGLAACTDPAFQRFREQLEDWFPRQI